MLELRKDVELPTGEKEAHSGCVSTPARMWDPSPPPLPLLAPVATESNAYIFSVLCFHSHSCDVGVSSAILLLKAASNWLRADCVSHFSASRESAFLIDNRKLVDIWGDSKRM